MKLNRTYFFIAASSIALIVVLIIQVNWILETAKMKKEMFDEKANTVLTKTAEAISADKQTCGSLKRGESNNAQHKIDSLFNHFMNLYNIHIDYYFEVKPATVTTVDVVDFSKNFPTNQSGSYQACVVDDSKNNISELKLVFPEMKQFILAEMSIPFITSVILIIVVLVLSWRTIFSLMKEKKIAEHTTEFLNNMTHEFKTPLTNIALAGKMMIKDSSIHEAEKIKHYSGIILEENEKLRLQVEQVLSMTALERGEIPLQKTELDFHQLIHDAVKCMSIQIENNEGDLKLKLEAERFVVMGDKSHLTNALCNLIDNAIKYSNNKPEIIIQTSNDSKNLIVVVSDKGIGIQKEFQKKVFEKFFRVPTGDVHDVKGFGLGLA